MLSQTALQKYQQYNNINTITLTNLKRQQLITNFTKWFLAYTNHYNIKKKKKKKNIFVFIKRKILKIYVFIHT